MLGGSISINNFCCKPVPSSEKKLVKPLKTAFSDPICTTKGSTCATPKIRNIFFLAEIIKADHQLPKNFYFKYHISRLSYESFLCYDFINKGSLSVKTAAAAF